MGDMMASCKEDLVGERTPFSLHGRHWRCLEKIYACHATIKVLEWPPGTNPYGGPYPVQQRRLRMRAERHLTKYKFAAASSGGAACTNVRPVQVQKVTVVRAELRTAGTADRLHAKMAEMRCKVFRNHRARKSFGAHP